ncbi:hypothetical protein BpHYR1_030290 [Brachionus plicatilis]|uniref:Uncharacterized protein n=1 Tax=Brachionus plicatilis TaxID=10195 RepID=A0A3M7RTE1_BRAPC|nr:hypothetical protein BpHYR1_030290 [Brachionus plicatilis]
MKILQIMVNFNLSIETIINKINLNHPTLKNKSKGELWSFKLFKKFIMNFSSQIYLFSNLKISPYNLAVFLHGEYFKNISPNDNFLKTNKNSSHFSSVLKLSLE